MSNKKILLCFTLITLNFLITVNSSIWDDFFKFQTCPPRPQLFTQLELKPFMGRWWSQIAIPNLFEQGKCGSTNYFYDDKNITVYNQDRELSGVNWIYSPVNSVTVDQPGVLSLHMYFIRSDLYVLDTDYTNYAIVYSCRSLFITKPFKLAWVLTRKPVISEEERAALYNKAEALFQPIEVKLSDMKSIVQDCDDA